MMAQPFTPGAHADIVRRGRVPRFAQIRARPFFCPSLASSWNQISIRLS
jgi:hypothetical protein